jgi:hypothetical protein
LRGLGRARADHLLAGLAGLSVAWTSLTVKEKKGWSWIGACFSLMLAAVARMDQLAVWIVLLYTGMFASSLLEWPRHFQNMSLSFQGVFTLAVCLWNFSSSFAEESHLAFCFVLQTVCLLDANWIVFLLLRLSKELNPGGDKWRNAVVPLCRYLHLPGELGAALPLVVLLSSQSVALVRTKNPA